jgi:hypothetical protein
LPVAAAFYWWRAIRGRSWRAVLTVVLVGGLLGAVALGAVAGARRTTSAYGRYLASANVSDALVNIPGQGPGAPLARSITLISQLPGIASSGAYVRLDALPVVHGRIDDSFATGGLAGSLAGQGFTDAYFRQDRMTVLAGRLPAFGSTRQIALTPRIASLFGVGVGGRVIYEFYRGNPLFVTPHPAGRIAFLVTAIVDIPPVLVDQSDQANAGILPPGATRQLAASDVYAWVGVRLDNGTAGIPALQRRLAVLAGQVARAGRLPGLEFNISRLDIARGQVQQAIRPQAITLAIFGLVAALAMLVLVGQGLAQLLGRSATGISALRTLGATRAQAAFAASVPGAIAIVGGTILAVTGAVALSPLAPVGPVRRFDPARGMQADGLVLGTGSVLLAAVLLGLLAVMAWRAVARRLATPGSGRPSVLARAAASAGLPASAVVGSRNALEPGSGQRAVPVRASLIGSVAAVTAVVAAVVFGTSLTGLVSHPARYGWNWDVLIQAEGGYGNFTPRAMGRLLKGQPAVAGWSSFEFSQLPVDGTVVPVLGLQRQSGFVEPPTSSGRPITGSGQIELGAVTLRELGKHIGDTVLVGIKPYRRPLTIVGTVILPSFGLALSDHVSLGRGAMLSGDSLLTAEGRSTATPGSESQVPQASPSAVAIDLIPGTSAAQRAQLIRRITSANPDGDPGGTYELTQYLAAAIVYAAQMGRQPLTLALGLAAAAALSLSLTVLASVRRRRRDLALLKALGMTRGQVRAIVSWQTTLILAVAVVVGAPLGIAVGSWAWRAFAGSLGVALVTVVPVLLLSAGAAALIVAGNLLTSLPAAVAARTAPAASLRSE